MLCYRCRQQPAQINDGDDGLGEVVCCDCYEAEPKVMNILPISDLHFEFHRDDGRSFIKTLDPTGVDVLVVAGDLTNIRLLPDALRALCAKFKQVVYVGGNHELYDDSPSRLADLRDKFKLPNLHWLEQSTATIDGVRFVGTTLWFPPPPPTALKRAYNDFRWIEGYEPWVYEQHEAAMAFLGRELGVRDVLVTHFLPLRESILPQYHDDPLNPFFWAGPHADALVKKASPRLVIHGHTHGSSDYELGDTRVVCNPFGYVAHDENPTFSTHLRVTVAA